MLLEIESDSNCYLLSKNDNEENYNLYLVGTKKLFHLCRIDAKAEGLVKCEKSLIEVARIIQEKNKQIEKIIDLNDNIQRI